jgi:hypothetical protein
MHMLKTESGSNGVCAIQPAQCIRKVELCKRPKLRWSKAVCAMRAASTRQEQEAMLARNPVSFEHCKATEGFVELDTAIPCRPGVLATADGSFQCLRQRWVDDLKSSGLETQSQHAILTTNEKGHDISSNSRSEAHRCDFSITLAIWLTPRSSSEL